MFGGINNEYFIRHKTIQDNNAFKGEKNCSIFYRHLVRGLSISVDTKKLYDIFQFVTNLWWLDGIV